GGGACASDLPRASRVGAGRGLRGDRELLPGREMSDLPAAELRFPAPIAPLPGPAVRWGVTLTALVIATAAAVFLSARARIAQAGAAGAFLYTSGKPDRAYPYLTAAAGRTWLQAKPCLDLGDLAVWTIDDGVFQHFYRFESAKPLVRLAFLS